MGFQKLRELTVFFPLYNEELNIPLLVEDALEVIPKYAEKFEILLINDGSTDGTKKVGEELAQKHPEVKIINQENKGYGGALKTGFTNASYDWIFYTDGDRQFKLDELAEFVYWSDTYSLVIGYRKNRAEGFKRSIVTKALKLWNKFFFNFPLEIKDIDCAFKLINKKVLTDVGALVTNGGMVSTELLLKAKQKNYLIKQLPVNHYSREFGNPTGDSLKVIKKAIIETWQLLKEFTLQARKLKLGLFAFTVFALLLPVSANINFMQNDDYTHYRMVESFLQGNFLLDQYLGAIFYLQGILGASFAFLFGIKSLPVLTLIASILAFYVFLRIINDFLETDFLTTILLGLLLFLNPLFLYSIWGFMTENYFMLFFLLSVYFVLAFIKSPSKKNFSLANILIISSYFIRQFAFVTSAAFAVYLLFKKKFGWALLQLALLGGLLYYHYNFFPITAQMYDGGLGLSPLFNYDRTKDLLIVFGIYLGIFTFPLIISYFLDLKLLKSPKKFLILLFIPFLFFVASDFEPGKIDFMARFRDGRVVPQFAKAEFPYLENVFGRKGYLENDLSGTKYHFPGYFDLFNALDILGKVGLAAFLVIFVLNWRYLFSFSAIYLAGFALLLIIAPKLFDRYLLGFVPMAILLLAAIVNKFGGLQKLIVLGFVFFLFVLGYQYSADFISINSYAWGRAEELSADENLLKELFNVNHSWRSLYPVEKRGWKYLFEYSESGRHNNEKFEVFETHSVNYPFNFYINPEVTVFVRKADLD